MNLESLRGNTKRLVDKYEESKAEPLSGPKKVKPERRLPSRAFTELKSKYEKPKGGTDSTAAPGSAKSSVPFKLVCQNAIQVEQEGLQVDEVQLKVVGNPPPALNKCPAHKKSLTVEQRRFRMKRSPFSILLSGKESRKKGGRTPPEQAGKRSDNKQLRRQLEPLDKVHDVAERLQKLLQSEEGEVKVKARGLFVELLQSKGVVYEEALLDEIAARLQFWGRFSVVNIVEKLEDIIESLPSSPSGDAECESDDRGLDEEPVFVI